MVTPVQRSLLIMLLILTAINLAGHISAPTQCCTVQENTSSAGDTDCLACTLQVGTWVPHSLIVEMASKPSCSSPGNPSLALSLVFDIPHPPIA
jgi:hypothetical protein